LLRTLVIYHKALRQGGNAKARGALPQEVRAAPNNLLDRKAEMARQILVPS